MDHAKPPRPLFHPKTRAWVVARTDASTTIRFGPKGAHTVAVAACLSDEDLDRIRIYVATTGNKVQIPADLKAIVGDPEWETARLEDARARRTVGQETDRG